MQTTRPLLGLLAALPVASAFANPNANPSLSTPVTEVELGKRPVRLDEIVVVGKSSDLLEQASSASFGIASSADLLARPVLRRSEILESIPGVVVTQHAGGGKATQYFLRGFNLDHGTDFLISIDGMPINMRTHAHGQGYADLNGLIPELVERIDYRKGTYFAENGDLSSAGSAHFRLFDSLPKNFASMELGQYGYGRVVAGNTFAVGKDPDAGKLTLAGEYNYYEGPWTLPEYFNRSNAFARYFKGDEQNHLLLTLMSYRGRWQSSDQIPLDLVQTGTLNRFGNLDPSNGGESERHSLQLHIHREEANSITTLNAYAVKYGLNLFSNFTYALDVDETSPSDQFEQSEQRWILGGDIAHTLQNLTFLGKESSLTLGVQTRTDLIDDIGLYKTVNRSRTKTQSLNDVTQFSIGIYAEHTVSWTKWLRTIAGIRADEFTFNTSTGNGQQSAGILNPKFTAIIGPFNKTELYTNFGTGFHSNDARGVTAQSDPAHPLVRAMGGEVGIRTQYIPNVTTSLALWYLRSDSELIYVGDAGTNEAGPGSRRHGIELSTYWKPCDFLSVDAEWSVTTSKLRDNPAGSEVTNSVPWMLSGGFVAGAQGDRPGWFAGTRVRAFGRRPLTEDGTVRGRPTCGVNANVGYRVKAWEFVLDCLNVLDRNDHDIEYFYESRTKTELKGTERTHFHPVEPRMFRFRITHKW
jgi:hypothetical protein